MTIPQTKDKIKYMKKSQKVLDDDSSMQNVIFTHSAPRNRTVNRYAVIGFILAFIISVIGLALCIVGFIKSKNLDGDGRGLAKAGIIISSVALALYTGLISFLAIAVHSTPLYS